MGETVATGDEEAINAAFGKVEECIIHKLDLDIFHHRIAFEITCNYGPQHITHHTIVFERVTACYYTLGAGMTRFRHLSEDPDPDPSVPLQVEWSSGGLTAGGVGTIRMTDPASVWAGGYDAMPNFSIEMSLWGLFIEAGRVTIDGTRFDVDVPAQQKRTKGQA